MTNHFRTFLEPLSFSLTCMLSPINKLANGVFVCTLVFRVANMVRRNGDRTRPMTFESGGASAASTTFWACRPRLHGPMVSMKQSQEEQNGEGRWVLRHPQMPESQFYSLSICPGICVFKIRSDFTRLVTAYGHDVGARQTADQFLNMTLARVTEANDGDVEAFNLDVGARRKIQNAKYEFKMVCGLDTSEE
jgi:hypothetical protein